MEKTRKIDYFCDFFLDILFMWYLYEKFSYKNQSIQLFNCLIKWCKLTRTFWISKPKAMKACTFKFLKLNQIEISRKWEKYKGPQMGHKVLYYWFSLLQLLKSLDCSPWTLPNFGICWGWFVSPTKFSPPSQAMIKSTNKLSCISEPHNFLHIHGQNSLSINYNLNFFYKWPFKYMMEDKVMQVLGFWANETNLWVLKH